MFEEVCLACGKHLKDDSTTYCSDECQYIDATSPVVSTSSSAFSSPNLVYAVGGEVPPLIPSALGMAFQGHSRDRHSISSSSASSTVWSATTDDDDDVFSGAVYSDHSLSDDPMNDGPSKSGLRTSTLLPSGKPRFMLYARRPSGTNNPTAPQPHRRTSSGSISGNVRDFPRSAPIHTHTTEDTDSSETCSDFGFTSRRHEELPQSAPLRHHKKMLKPKYRVKSDADADDDDSEYRQTIKKKRSRNRASLPGYFSLLQMGSSVKSPATSASQPSGPAASRLLKSSPSVSSSSGFTIASPSPPTPRLSHAGIVPGLISSPTELRDRRAMMALSAVSSRAGLGMSRASSRSASSSNDGRSLTQERTQSPPKQIIGRLADILASAEQGSNGRKDATVERQSHRSNVERELDWNPDLLPPRGRASIRRNSSPPKISSFTLGMMGLGSENRATSPSAMYNRDCDKRDSHTASPPRNRGRTRVEALEGVGTAAWAPGYGLGRSGILDRQRRASSRRYGGPN